ncbi:MAG: circadian clock protein KaiC [Thermoleophilia bacterium]|nr:circadian clock protein KaiC [Thermoleophilia bacterium]
MTETVMHGIEKHPTYIEGLDLIGNGGIPRGRTTLVAGTAGAGKTVLATQFLVEGIRRDGEGAVFVTFEERPEDIHINMSSFGWDLAAYEADGSFAFVDAAPDHQQASSVVGAFDLEALMLRVRHAIERTSATRVVIDSIGAVFSQFPDTPEVRRELLRMFDTLRRLGVTAIMTAERENEYGPIARFGVEEFVADNVILLRNVLDDERRRRTVEILKFRGTAHQKGQFPVTIISSGMHVVPLSAIELSQNSTDVRISSGIEELDEMCGGGLFRDSVVLASGATGCGKTLLVSHFVAAAAARGERTLLYAFEESREQLFRNAAGWGIDFEGFERDGLLVVDCTYPETAALEDHLLRIKQGLAEHQPDRVAVDSLSALERISSERSFREFVLGLTSFVKSHDIAGLFTSTTAELFGGTSITEAHISTITDTIILLRYVERHGEVLRAITVLKMRGSNHDKRIREFSIDSTGMHVRAAFRSIAGILAGSPMHLPDQMDGEIRHAVPAPGH